MSEENKIGWILRKTRKEMNLEISEVCQKLNVKISDIEALESHGWDKINKNLYVAGLISSYAKILKLDANLINDKIKELPIESNVKNLKHKLVNIGEHIDLTPDKEMFFNFLTAFFLIFLVLLAILSSSKKHSNHTSVKSIVAKVIEATPETEIQDIEENTPSQINEI